MEGTTTNCTFLAKGVQAETCAKGKLHQADAGDASKDYLLSQEVDQIWECLCMIC